MTNLVGTIYNPDHTPFSGVLRVLGRESRMLTQRVEGGKINLSLPSGTYKIQCVPSGAATPFRCQERWEVPESGVPIDIEEVKTDDFLNIAKRLKTQEQIVSSLQTDSQEVKALSDKVKEQEWTIKRNSDKVKVLNNTLAKSHLDIQALQERVDDLDEFVVEMQGRDKQSSNNSTQELIDSIKGSAFEREYLSEEIQKLKEQVNNIKIPEPPDTRSLRSAIDAVREENNHQNEVLSKKIDNCYQQTGQLSEQVDRVNGLENDINTIKKENGELSTEIQDRGIEQRKLVENIQSQIDDQVKQLAESQNDRFMQEIDDCKEQYGFVKQRLNRIESLLWNDRKEENDYKTVIKKIKSSNQVENVVNDNQEYLSEEIQKLKEQVNNIKIPEPPDTRSLRSAIDAVREENNHQNEVLSKKIDNCYQQTGQLSEQVDRVNGVENDINALRSAIDAVREENKQLSGEIYVERNNRLKQEDSLLKKIDEVDASNQLEQIDQWISALSEQVYNSPVSADIVDEINLIKKNLSNQRDSLESLQSAVNDLDAKIEQQSPDPLQSAIDTVKRSDISQVEKDISQLKERLEGITASPPSSTDSSNLRSIHQRIDGVEAKLRSSLQETVSDYNSKINATLQRIEDIQEKITHFTDSESEDMDMKTIRTFIEGKRRNGNQS